MSEELTMAWEIRVFLGSGALYDEACSRFEAREIALPGGTHRIQPEPFESRGLVIHPDPSGNPFVILSSFDLPSGLEGQPISFIAMSATILRERVELLSLKMRGDFPGILDLAHRLADLSERWRFLQEETRSNIVYNSDHVTRRFSFHVDTVAPDVAHEIVKEAVAFEGKLLDKSAATTN
jgi:hypothetical protein